MNLYSILCPSQLSLSMVCTCNTTIYRNDSSIQYVLHCSTMYNAYFTLIRSHFRYKQREKRNTTSKHGENTPADPKWAPIHSYKGVVQRSIHSIRDPAYRCTITPRLCACLWPSAVVAGGGQETVGFGAFVRCGRRRAFILGLVCFIGWFGPKVQ